MKNLYRRGRARDTYVGNAFFPRKIFFNKHVTSQHRSQHFDTIRVEKEAKLRKEKQVSPLMSDAFRKTILIDHHHVRDEMCTAVRKKAK